MPLTNDPLMTYMKKKITKNCQMQYIVHKLSLPTLEFQSPELSGMVTYYADSDIFVVKRKFNHIGSRVMQYWAANPIYRNYSYAGSGLPYPNPAEAYENTPNQGDVLLDRDGQFEIKLDHPSGYYLRQGKILLKPHVHLQVQGDDTVYTVVISDDFPNRLKNLPDRPNRSLNR